MTIAVVCSSCAARFTAPDSARGKAAKCPKCSAPITIGGQVPIGQPGSHGNAVVHARQHREPPPPLVSASKSTSESPGDAPQEVARPMLRFPIPVERKENLSRTVEGKVDTFLSAFIKDDQDPAVVGQVCTRVQQILTSGEEIKYVAVQKKPIVNIAPDCVVLTNKRFIIYKPKLLGQVSFTDYIWRDVHDARLAEGIMGATLTFRTATGQFSLDYLPKAQARKLYRHAQEMEEAVREERRDRDLEEKRAAAGSVVVQNAMLPNQVAEQAPQQDHLETLKKLKQMLDAGLISPAEYEAKKSEILARM